MLNDTVTTDAARQEVGFVTTEEVVIDEDFLLDEFDGDGTESTPITTGGKEEDQSSENTVPSTAALFNPTKLKILEQQCNSQLEQNKGTPIVTSEALLCENPNVPTVESVPVSVTARYIVFLFVLCDIYHYVSWF